MRLRPAPQTAALARLAIALTRHRVPYCAIGGFAVSMYAPERVPDDLDVVLAPTTVAGERAVLAVAALMHGREEQVLADAADLAQGGQLVVPTASGTLHILGAHLPPGIDRARLVARGRWWTVGAVPIRIARLEDLIAIKVTARHGRDADDVALLRASRPGGRLRRDRPR